MPFISNEELARITDYVHGARDSVAKAHAKRMEKGRIRDAVNIGEALGAAAVSGFARGKLEKPDGSFNIPGTQVDIEGAASLLGLGFAIMSPGKRFTEDLLMVSLGIGSHYVGQIGRKFGKTGTFSLVAGGNVAPEHELIGRHVAGHLRAPQVSVGYPTPYQDAGAAPAFSGVDDEALRSALQAVP